MYDVFICCTSTDVKIAERLSAYLKYYSIECFVAHRDIPEDVPWAYGIAEAIRSSKMMIALFSEDFNTGTWMDDELNTANSAGVPIVTFRLSNDVFSESKAMFLKNTACVDGCEGAEVKFPMIYEEVCNMLGMPMEDALPVDEVLITKQPENVQSTTKKENNEPDTQEEMMAEPNKKVSHNLFSAVLIGGLLTFIVVMLLEWILD